MKTCSIKDAHVVIKYEIITFENLITSGSPAGHAQPQLPPLDVEEPRPTSSPCSSGRAQNEPLVLVVNKTCKNQMCSVSTTVLQLVDTQIKSLLD